MMVAALIAVPSNEQQSVIRATKCYSVFTTLLCIWSLSLGTPFRYGFLILVVLALSLLCSKIHGQHYRKRK